MGQMSRVATPNKNEQEAARPVRQSPKNCVHHWRIESPNGRESVGVCQRCGSKRKFSNSTESVMWEQTNTLRNDANRAAMRTSKVNEVSLADEA
jgi:hypothetical protein